MICRELRVFAILFVVNAAEWFSAVPAGISSPTAHAQTLISPARAEAAMAKAADFFTTKIAVHGGYVYYTSLDSPLRLGEGIATKDQIWVQAPGTPTVGMAFLAAYKATGDARYLQAARDAADALIYGQLQSGGWTASIDFDPKGKGTALYRIGKGRGKNNSSLDDGITQQTLRFLIQLDVIEQGRNGSVREAVKLGLQALFAAQFPNGGFPQVWSGPSLSRPIVAAKYPDYDWRTENRVKEYWNHYTLNDGLAGTVAELLVEASEVYPTVPQCKEALLKLGDFLRLSQMPDPQPAWAQQYDAQMRPAWARKFEPPSIAGQESQDAIATLLLIYEVTGDEKYLAPVERAIKYLQASLLSDGQLARFYELQTNRPLYMTSQYKLTYDDTDLPSHYGWKSRSKLESLHQRFIQAKSGQRQRARSKQVLTTQLEKAASSVVRELDSEGRWVSEFKGERLTGQPEMKPGEKFISSERFAKSITVLADYLTAASSPPSD